MTQERQSGRPRKPAPGRPAPPAPPRDARLAEALRANLRRRKAQARARGPDDGAEPS
jgi:hypothetical protein